MNRIMYNLPSSDNSVSELSEIRLAFTLCAVALRKAAKILPTLYLFNFFAYS